MIGPVPEPILTITDAALEKVLDIRAQEPDAGDLGLAIRITGVSGATFSYEITMLRVADLPGDAHVERHGDLPVYVPADSIDRLQGATLGMSRDLLNPGLAIQNPNSPSPAVGGVGPPPDLSGPVAERVAQVLEQQINPAIAAHGGYAQLVAVEDGTAYLRLGGGCQGCGMASVTLSQGIERAIKEAVPEVVAVMDVTDHGSGENPYYEAAKK
jgi:Fe/S biogenesis protein NfuA